jgi:transcriptional regulator GlxA family with amidase domain
LALSLKDPAAMEKKRSPIDPRIAWAVALMHRRLAQPLAITALAAHVSLSPSRFRQLFITQTGVAPARYLQRLRLRRARLLIERTFLSVKEVMTLVGYHDPSHFSRDFRRHHGMPPSALRGTEAATPMRRLVRAFATHETAQLSKAPKSINRSGSGGAAGRRHGPPLGQRRMR